MKLRNEPPFPGDEDEDYSLGAPRLPTTATAPEVAAHIRKFVAELPA